MAQSEGSLGQEGEGGLEERGAGAGGRQGEQGARAAGAGLGQGLEEGGKSEEVSWTDARVLLLQVRQAAGVGGALPVQPEGGAGSWYIYE